MRGVPGHTPRPAQRGPGKKEGVCVGCTSSPPVPIRLGDQTQLGSLLPGVAVSRAPEPIVTLSLGDVPYGL